MVTVFIILIILASFILGLFVLIQNPKGGGLAGNIAGFSTQFMGVKQTTDVLEKGTWIFAAIIGILCLVSTLFISGSNASVGKDRTQGVTTGGVPVQTTTPVNTQQTVPNQQAPSNGQQQNPQGK